MDQKKFFLFYLQHHQYLNISKISNQIKNHFVLEQECAKVPPWMMSSLESSKAINRIVGGDNAPSPIPWQVRVAVGGFLCGGTILDETTILSAAHCFYPPPYLSSYDIIEAGIKMQGSLDGQKISVREVVNHPMYNSMKMDNDVAILKLTSSLTFNENVQPACLPDPSFTPEDSGEFAVVSGWGTTSEGT